jgi:hypothetical protein
MDTMLAYYLLEGNKPSSNLKHLGRVYMEAAIVSNPTTEITEVVRLNCHTDDTFCTRGESYLVIVEDEVGFTIMGDDGQVHVVTKEIVKGYSYKIWFSVRRIPLR